MKRALMIAFWLLAAAAASGARAGSCESLASLAWLVGDWTAAGSESSFHETWAMAGPATLEGRGIEWSPANGAIRNSESLRLVEMAGGVFYLAKVAHNELPVAFRLTACGDDGVFVFENPLHDFPRRLEYIHSADGTLAVRVSDGSDRGFDLAFTRDHDCVDFSGSVLAAEDARFSAMEAGDAAAMRRWFADDLVYVHSNGLVEDRDQLITSIASRRTRYVGVTPVERKVVRLGNDFALVRGLGRFQVEAGGDAFELQLRYLAVYGRHDNIWQLRSWQSLRTP